MNLLLMGYSTRSMAMSALKGGYRVQTLDYFGDWDQKSIAPNLSLKRDLDLPYNGANLIKASERMRFDAISYSSDLENQPETVAALARRARLIGNQPGTLVRVKDWALLQSCCRQFSLPFPATLPAGGAHLAHPGAGWLAKPAKGGGGKGIRIWRGEPLASNYILQTRLYGQSASAAFVADGKRARLLGLTEQLIGLDQFNAKPFQWCGNIFPLSLSAEQIKSVVKQVKRIIEILAQCFGLKGCCGLDFILLDSPDKGLTVWPLEVNPRFTGAMELLDMAGEAVFDKHVKACLGQLPSAADEPGAVDQFLGKGIVYAPYDLRFDDTSNWLAKQRRDIPHPGESIGRGSPICSILAKGRTREQCWKNLIKSAGQVVREGRAVKPGLAPIPQSPREAVAWQACP